MWVEIALETILLVLFGVLDQENIPDEIEHTLQDEVLFFGPLLPVLVDNLVHASAYDSRECLVCERLFHGLESIVDLDEYVKVNLVVGYFEIERVERRLGQIDQETKSQIEQFGFFFGFDAFHEWYEIVAYGVTLEQLASHRLLGWIISTQKADEIFGSVFGLEILISRKQILL